MSIEEVRQLREVTYVRVKRDTADKLFILKRRLHLRSMSDVIDVLVASYVKYQRIRENCPEIAETCSEKKKKEDKGEEK